MSNIRPAPRERMILAAGASTPHPRLSHLTAPAQLGGFPAHQSSPMESPGSANSSASRQRTNSELQMPLRSSLSRSIPAAHAPQLLQPPVTGRTTNSSSTGRSSLRRSVSAYIKTADAIILKDPALYADLKRYTAFLLLFVIISLGRTDPNTSNYFRTALSHRFAPPVDKVDSAGNRQPSFKGITSIADIWQFLNQSFVPALVADPSIYGNRGYDGSFIIGALQLRQHRVIDEPCSSSQIIAGPHSAATAPPTCRPSTLSSATEARAPFGRGSAFVWSEAIQADLNAWMLSPNPSWGDGGYSVLFTPETASSVFGSLRDGGWIDRNTFVVSVDFSTYNPGLNIFCAITLEVLTPSFGGAQPAAYIRIADILLYETLMMKIIGAFEVLFIAAYVNLVWMTWKEMRAMGLIAFLWSSWGIIDLANLGIFLAVIVARAIHLVAGDRLIALTVTDPFVNWRNFAFTTTQVHNMNAFNAVLTWIKILKYLGRFSLAMADLERIFLNSRINLAAYVFIFGVVFVGFTQAFFMAFHGEISSFDSMMRTFLTLFSAMFGGFDFEPVVKANWLLGPSLNVIFALFIALFLLNVFLAIIHGSFNAVQAEKELEAKGCPVGEIVTQALKTRGSIVADPNAVAALRPGETTIVTKRPAPESDDDGDDDDDDDDADNLPGIVQYK